MKKLFRSFALGLAIAGAGLTTVSCDSDTISQLIDVVLGNLVNTGQTYTYTGTANIQCLEGASADQLAEVAKGTAQLQVILKSSTTGTLTIQGFTLDKASMTTVTLNNLAMTTDANKTKTTLSIGDNSAFGQNDSFTYNGKTYPASNLHIETATATSDAIALKMTIWFGDYTDAVNLEYTGKAVSQ